jgi:hypothetical protein
LLRPAGKPLPQSRVGSQPQPWQGWTSTATGHSSTQGHWRLCECQVQPALDPPASVGQSLPTSCVELRPATRRTADALTRLGRLSPGRRPLDADTTRANAVDDLAPIQTQRSSALSLPCLQGCPDRTHEGKPTYDVRYRVPSIERLAVFVTPEEAAAATITIQYRSQFSLKPHDMLPLLDGAQGVSSRLIASPLLATPRRLRASTSTRRGGRRVCRRSGVMGNGEAGKAATRI